MFCLGYVGVKNGEQMFEKRRVWSQKDKRSYDKDDFQAFSSCFLFPPYEQLLTLSNVDI